MPSDLKKKKAQKKKAASQAKDNKKKVVTEENGENGEAATNGVSNGACANGEYFTGFLCTISRAVRIL